MSNSSHANPDGFSSEDWEIIKNFLITSFIVFLVWAFLSRNVIRLYLFGERVQATSIGYVRTDTGVIDTRFNRVRVDRIKYKFPLRDGTVQEGEQEAMIGNLSYGKNPTILYSRSNPSISRLYRPVVDAIQLFAIGGMGCLFGVCILRIPIGIAMDQLKSGASRTMQLPE